MIRLLRRPLPVLVATATVFLFVGMIPLPPAMAAGLLGTPAPSSAATLPFCDAVNMLGLYTYPQVYAGDVLHADGSCTIYVTSAKAALEAAVFAEDTSNTPYSFVTVPNSYATMENLTLSIAASSTLTASGVNLTSWGPDPTTGLVQAHVAQPSATQMSKLASTMALRATAVTVSSYPSAVQTLLQRQFGSIVVVAPTYEPRATASGRTDDTSPFFGGDQIKSNSTGAGCSGGFPVENGSGTTYMGTAGHCGAGPWVVSGNGAVMGNVANKWLNNSSHDDFEEIGTSVLGYVQCGAISSPQLCGIVAQPFVPSNGEGIAWDGSITGEVRNVQVTGTGLCKTFSDGIERCHLVSSSNWPTQVDQGGDSGGPVFHHQTETSNNIQPIGEIIGATFGPGGTAYAEEMTEIDSVAGVSVVQD